MFWPSRMFVQFGTQGFIMVRFPRLHNIIPEDTCDDDPGDQEAEQQAQQAAQQTMQIATGYIVGAALQVAVKLEIADQIAAGVNSTADLTRESGVEEDPPYRMMRTLAAVGRVRGDGAAFVRDDARCRHVTQRSRIDVRHGVVVN
jgi:hypothetical protein